MKKAKPAGKGLMNTIQKAMAQLKIILEQLKTFKSKPTHIKPQAKKSKKSSTKKRKLPTVKPKGSRNRASKNRSQ